MCERYCKDERTIILAVVPANQDMAISDGLQLARQLDQEGIRTIGCITKIDIMDKGTNAKKMLMNEEIPLKLGFVGIKGRSQDDVNKGVKVAAALESERLWFAKHPVYSGLPSAKLGTTALVSTLSTTMYTHIRRTLPSIIMEIDEKMHDCEVNLSDLGNPMPMDEKERLKMLWEMISVFSEKYKAAILANYSERNKKHTAEYMGGAKVKMIFNELYSMYLNPSYKASNGFSEKHIQHAVDIHQGDNLAGFLSSGAFMS